MVVCNLAAQQVPFNAIFLVSDPMQKWRLFANFVLYFLPFLAGALYLGIVFLKAQKTFNRVYFADLVGSGLCGLSVLLAMYFFRPDDLIMAPLLLWLAGGVLWFVALGDRRGIGAIVIVAILSAVVHYMAPSVLGIPKLAVSDYKGVVLRPQVPRQPAHLRTRLAVRLPGDLLELLPALRAGPVGQRRVQPADHAGERLSRPLHRLRGPVRHHQGPAGRARRRTSSTCRCIYPYILKQNARHLRRPVRRRHLDRGGAEGGLGPCHRRRGQSRDPDGVPRGQGAARLHRRHPQQSQGHRHRL